MKHRGGIFGRSGLPLSISLKWYSVEKPASAPSDSVTQTSMHITVVCLTPLLEMLWSLRPSISIFNGYKGRYS